MGLLTAFQVTPDGLVISWGAIGTMVAVSSAISSALLAYLRVFVGSKLSTHETNVGLRLAAHETKLITFKGELSQEIQQSSAKSFLIGEVVDTRLKEVTRRLDRLEEDAT